MPRDPEQPELEFESHLPAGQQWFTLSGLVATLGCARQHLINLCETGAFEFGGIGPVNHALQPDETRATTRIPRGAIVSYLNARRRNLIDPEVPVLDFNGHLSSDQQWFPVHWLARSWHLTSQHVINLCNAGAFDAGGVTPVNIAARPKETRATTRIPRAAVLAYLNSRKKTL